MASHPESLSMALFCDFENVALGVRDAQYEKFDIRPVLERLLLKGSIVVKKAYCDWDRYKGFKAAMHEANFELIEIPHVRQSGKNSADIRLVVDALDLCYTKSHVDTFVIISGDSDFSPLVSKLRENAKQVIGVGIKQSTSDLLIANCDEFIFYDDLVRESQRAAARREPRGGQPAARRTADEDKPRKDDLEARRTKAIELAVATFDALVSERGDSGKMWASVLKEAIKRRRPDFNESYFGFKAFGNLLEAAQQRGLIQVGRDEKSGTYVYRSLAEEEGDIGYPIPASLPDVPEENVEERSTRLDPGPAGAPASEARRRGRGGRGSREHGRNDAGPGTPVSVQPPASSADDVAAVSADQDASQVDAGLVADEPAASAVSQDSSPATTGPEPASTGAMGLPATDLPLREAAARKRPRRGRQERSARGDATPPQATAEQVQSTAMHPAATLQPAGAQHEGASATPREAQALPSVAAEPAAGPRAEAREDGPETSGQPGGKPGARKTRSGAGRAAKKEAAAPAPVAEPAAPDGQAASGASQDAEQAARKSARKRPSTRSAKKSSSAAKSETARESGGE